MKKPVTLTIDDSVIAKGKKKAKKDSRSLSGYVEQLIKKDCDD